MNFCKIVVSPNQRLNDIFEVINTTTCKKILFIFPAHYPQLLEKQCINKLKKLANTNEKDLIIVSSKKLVRDFLKKSDIIAYSIIPAKFKDGEKISLFNFLNSSVLIDAKTDKKKPEIKTNQTEKKELETKKSSKTIPVFSLKKIESNSSVRAKIFFGVLAFLLMALGVFYWQKPTAHIVLRPRISVVPVLQNMVLKLPTAEVDQTEKTLPVIKSILLNVSVSDEEIVPASGREYEVTNARGKVTLFNETDTPKFLVPSRLQTSNGLIFRFNKNITIPAKKNQKAGRVVVDIIADELDIDGNQYVFWNGDPGYFFIIQERPGELRFGLDIPVPNKKGNIKPNLSARVSLNDYSSDDAILVPQEIISENADGEQYVYVASEPNDDKAVATRRIIKTGKTQGSSVEVLSGIIDGDLLIKEGARTVKEGQNVQILNSESDE